MKEPGLDNRHRDKNPPKAGEIQQKRSDTLNKPDSNSTVRGLTRRSETCGKKQVSWAWKRCEELRSTAVRNLLRKTNNVGNLRGHQLRQSK